MTTRDDQGRRRVGPDQRRTPVDALLPQRHGKWWNFDAAKGTTKTADELRAQLACVTTEAAQDRLAHVEAIAATATERAASADRRATTIAGTVAIAASFTLSGAALILDASKVDDRSSRQLLAIVLFVTTVSFALSAFYALMGLVGTRRWNWNDPHELDHLEAETADGDDDAVQRHNRDARTHNLAVRAAYVLDHFAGNWEISDVKTRHVDLALRWLLFALVGIAVFAGLVAFVVV
jgi:hypothetical protein